MVTLEKDSGCVDWKFKMRTLRQHYILAIGSDRAFNTAIKESKALTFG